MTAGSYFRRQFCPMPWGYDEAACLAVEIAEELLATGKDLRAYCGLDMDAVRRWAAGLHYSPQALDALKVAILCLKKSFRPRKPIERIDEAHTIAANRLKEAGEYRPQHEGATAWSLV